MQYEELGEIPQELGDWALENALSKLAFMEPTLYVHPSRVATARRYAHGARINYATCEALRPSEWFVEFNGQRIGSAAWD